MFCLQPKNPFFNPPHNLA